MSTGSDLITLIGSRQNLDDYQKKHWTGSFAEYLDIVQRDPKVTRTAYQRIYDMIISHGTEEVVVNKEKLIRYKFFEDPENDGQDAIFGLERTLMNFVNILKSAANGYGTERRVLLLHGPVGSSKSTLARLLKKGLERYSRVEEGQPLQLRLEGRRARRRRAVRPLPHARGAAAPDPARAPRRGDRPLERWASAATISRSSIEGDLCPFCRQMFNERMERYGGDWSRVVEDVRVRRLILSEQDRIGIGTFQPKDEKNQDSTELTGDINYRKIAEYGTESDPRAFNFDGEFNIANRGIIEFIEVLKLDVAFLYDLLGASQEHKIKPKKFAQTDIDEVIIGHTNEPEYKKLQSNEFMEALRDRTVKIDVPYVTRLTDEIKIYEKDYNSRKVRGKHLAPHTLEIAAMWAVLTRLEEPKNASLTLMQKLKLYNGKTLPGFTEDNIKELREEAEREGMHGISPRYVQDKISNALVAHPNERSINPFMVLNELEAGLKHHSLINSEETRKHYRHLLVAREGRIRGHREERGAAGHRRRRGRPHPPLRQLHRQRQGLHPARKGQEQVHRPDRGARRAADAVDRGEDRHPREPQGRLPPRDHELHRRPVARRQEVRLQDQRAAAEGPRAEAVRGPEGHDQADEPGLERRRQGHAGEDRHRQGRLIRNYGYDEDSATDVLNYVASIFARGDVKRGSH